MANVSVLVFCKEPCKLIMCMLIINKEVTIRSKALQTTHLKATNPKTSSVQVSQSVLSSGV